MAFAYTAKDPLGKIFRGSLDVPTEEDARQQLLHPRTCGIFAEPVRDRYPH